MTYKRAGDGFLIDSVCESGYTITFYPRNVQPPKKWVNRGYSPTHSRILFMLNTLKDKYHTCGMDNLFISAKFLRGAFVELDSKVMVHGVCRLNGRGLPSCIFQTDHKNDKKRACLHYGDVKAATLVGDSKCPNLVAFSIYDSKPVYFLTTAAEKIVWEKNTRSVFDKTVKKKVKIEYYRSNIQNFYNFYMNSVDVADQLRNSYGFQHWIRNRKWWWALFMWGFGVLLVNTYIIYKTAHIFIWCTDKKDIMSQYEFRKSVALSFILNDDKKSRTSRTESTTTKSVSSCSTSKKSLSVAESRGRRGNQQDNLHSKRKAKRFNDKTLNPMTGSLSDRLNPVYNHLPENNVAEQRNKSLRCQLHRWTDRNIEYKNNVMVCTHCNVSLCLHCYKAFHTIKHVKELKKIVSDTIIKYDHCPTVRNR